METKKETIKYIKEQLKKVPEGQKVKLSNESILKLFFEKEKTGDKTYKFIQSEVDSILDKIDMSDFISEYSHEINMLIGANCESSNLKYKDAYYTFLMPGFFTATNLGNIKALDKLKTIPETNLSNNDFSYCGEGWDLAKFLYVVRENVESYVSSKYSDEYRGICRVEELDFPETYVDNSYLENLQKQKISELKSLIKKLIPNLQNTGLKINFHPTSKQHLDRIDYEIISETLESKKFDGCYVSAELLNENGFLENIITAENKFYYDKDLKSQIKRK